MIREATREERQEKRDADEALRTNARLPDGVQDLKGMHFINIHNSIVMVIEKSWVGDTGVVLWTSFTGDVYSTSDIEKHWARCDFPWVIKVGEEE